MLVFAVVVTMATALACGLVPALRLARSDPNRAIMQQSRAATGTRRQGRFAGVVLAVGLVAGTVGALVLSRWLTTLAFGISPRTLEFR